MTPEEILENLVKIQKRLNRSYFLLGFWLGLTFVSFLVTLFFVLLAVARKP